MPMDPSQFLSGLKEAQRRQVEAAQQAVDVIGEQIIGDAQELTPVKTGALQASGTTRPATIEDGSIQKEIGFNTDYAAAVHEITTHKHAQGQAKYLSTAMASDAPKVGAFVSKAMKAATDE